MYTLLLIDDEPEIRVGLREVISFEEYGFEVVGEAANGLEGIQKAEELRPDLIITDIRMPLMDGLTMCAEIRKVLPATQFMILSGYDDFEYARQAIELRTMAYLLKPISAEEFKQMLKDMRKKLDEEFARRKDLVQLKRHYHNSLPLLREMLLNSILSGGIAAQKALDNAKGYEMPLESPFYSLALMRMDHTAQDILQQMEESELLSFAVVNILKEVLNKGCTVYVFHYDGMLAALFLLQKNGTAIQEETIAALDEARRNVQHYLETSLLIGLSAAVPSLAQLPTAAQQAVSALQQSCMYDKNEVLCITDIEPGSTQAIAPDDSLMRALMSALKTNDAASIQENLKQLISVCEHRKLTLKAYRAYLMEIMVALFHIIRDMDVDERDYESVLREVMRCPVPQQALTLLTDIYLKVSDDIASRRTDTGTRIAADAQAFLRENYGMENLNMEMLCAQVHISSSYFSMVFKKETGKTFHQYLTDLRMDKAMTLLAQGDVRTSEVARSVGIPDPSYFSYVFKKHHGISPSQVRRLQGGTP